MLTFVLTGKMDRPRAEYEDIICNAGHKVGSSVTKNTDYLVMANPNSTSTKAQKARALGIRLIAPEDLDEVLAG